GGPLAAALDDSADPDLIFAAVSDQLASTPPPTVLVVEDAHWADSATVDVLRHVARRITELPAVLLVTYRDADLARGHPLRGVLGGLSSTEAQRLKLAPLSADAVSLLAADSDVDAADLFRLTGGNPFFVTEAMADRDAGVPLSVVDAVMARVLALSPAA